MVGKKFSVTWMNYIDGIKDIAKSAQEHPDEGLKVTVAAIQEAIEENMFVNIAREVMVLLFNRMFLVKYGI